MIYFKKNEGGIKMDSNNLNVNQGYEGLEEPVSLGEWVILYLIMMVPLVNIIMLFVWGFGSGTKKSKANYCKASLIFMAIGFVLSLLLFSTIGAAIASLASLG